MDPSHPHHNSIGAIPDRSHTQRWTFRSRTIAVRTAACHGHHAYVNAHVGGQRCA
jgi:hypothetical protein